jgi:hypothetical protein
MLVTMLEVLDAHAIGMTNQHVPSGWNRLRRLEHFHANGRQMGREALNVIDHEGRLRLDEGRKAFLRAGDEQNGGNLGQSQIVFVVVKAQSSLLADQRLMEGDRRIKAFQRKIAPDQNVQNFHDRLASVAPTTGAPREVWGE